MRTTAAAVKGIITTSADDTRIENFIEAATAVVDQHLTDDDLTDAQLELIERWLAAHFLAVDDARISSQSAGGVSLGFKHMGQTKTGILSTTYGQQAVVLDPTGKLAALTATKTSASLRIAGL